MGTQRPGSWDLMHARAQKPGPDLGEGFWQLDQQQRVESRGERGQQRRQQLALRGGSQ